jgi:hypothetical protein
MTSEEIFQAQKIAMMRAFEAGGQADLGLGSACNHDGLKITNLGQGVEWIGRYGHGATGRLSVTVYEEGCSTPIPETDVAAAVMAIATGAVPDGKVYDRMVLAVTDEEFARLYAETGGAANVWIVRQTAQELIRGNGISNELLAINYAFEFFYWRRDLREYSIAVLAGIQLEQGGAVELEQGGGILEEAA